LDRRLTSLLLAEIDSQCRLVLVAEEHLAQAEQMPMRPGISRIEYFWSAVQGIVLGAGNLRNLLWTGIGGRGPKADKLRSEQIAERADMRKSLGVNESSSLRSAVLRNSLEHFDERITDWYRANPSGSYLTRGLITRRDQAQFASGAAFFGLYERATGNVIFQEHAANVYEIVAECRRIQPLADAEMIRLIQLDQREQREAQQRRKRCRSRCGRPNSPLSAAADRTAVNAGVARSFVLRDCPMVVG
jgi:hypothetical protein